MAGPLPLDLLPDTAEVGADGGTSIGGCDLVDLADEFGTPLFVYDEAHLRARCREAVAAFGEGVAYAGKAFLCGAMARLVVEEGMYLDVATGGELYMARHAGVPADRLILHGNNKSELELEMAIEEGVGLIVVDSFDELDRLGDELVDEPDVGELVVDGRGRELEAHELVIARPHGEIAQHAEHRLRNGRAHEVARGRRDRLEAREHGRRVELPQHRLLDVALVPHTVEVGEIAAAAGVPERERAVQHLLAGRDLADDGPAVHADVDRLLHRHPHAAERVDEPGEPGHVDEHGVLHLDAGDTAHGVFHGLDRGRAALALGIGVQLGVLLRPRVEVGEQAVVAAVEPVRPRLPQR